MKAWYFGSCTSDPLSWRTAPSTHQKPALWRVSSYSAPGLPRPAINRIIRALSSVVGPRQRRDLPVARRAHELDRLGAAALERHAVQRAAPGVAQPALGDGALDI